MNHVNCGCIPFVSGAIESTNFLLRSLLSKSHNMRFVHLMLSHNLHHAVGPEGGSLSAICISFATATPANGVAPNVGWSWITVHG